MGEHDALGLAAGAAGVEQDAGSSGLARCGQRDMPLKPSVERMRSTPRALFLDEVEHGSTVMTASSSAFDDELEFVGLER